jgi:polysaccharide export outer membrane protein
LLSAKTEGNQNGAPSLALPPQIVDNTGKITVPYAGAIRVSGVTPQQAQAIIVRKLSSRAIEPQAIVSVTANESRLVSVTGDVERAGRVPLNTGNEHLLDAIAMSGGAKGRQDDEYVKLTRGSQSEEMRLSRLIEQPKENVQLQPGDQISIYQNPQKFVAMGASNASAEINFASDNLSLSEAIGRAGGMDDRRSDPAGIFVFRYEADDVYRNLFGLSDGKNADAVVYRLDLHNPTSLLAAQRFPIKNKDVVYFANSPSTELGKFLNLVGLGVAVTNGSAVAVARVAP